MDFPELPRDMSRGFCGCESDARALDQISEELCVLDQFELDVAENLGISTENVDSATVFIEAKRNALPNGDSAGLAKLEKLHVLRLQHSLAQSKLPIILNGFPLRPGVPHRVDASKFWVVLIGINEYASYPLLGCVPDALLMKKYLTEDLGVPSNRIQLLLGSNEHTSHEDPMTPTRSHIIATLLNIIINPDIAYGDNIVLYYSGHGSNYTRHIKECDVKEYIEALCPIDRDTLDDDGFPIPDISDREINAILQLISLAKGDHITVILDCCFSGGITRSIPEPGARTAPPMMRATVQDMLLAGEKDLKNYPGYRSILSKDWLPNTNTHVLLAACTHFQFANRKEVTRADGSVVEHIGIFTDSLVRLLQSGELKENTTYTDLIRLVDKTNQQTPVVVGKQKEARVWYQK